MQNSSTSLSDFCKANNINISKVNYIKMEHFSNKLNSINVIVYGSSMNPSIPNNSIVTAKLRNSKYKFGDIVLAKGENTFLVHRLISFKRKLLKGDNNLFFDSGKFEIVGKVMANYDLSTYIGSIISYIEGHINLRRKKPTSVLIKWKYFFFKQIGVEP